MPEYGYCCKCGEEIDPAAGYSNRQGVIKERICLSCKFNVVADEEQTMTVSLGTGNDGSTQWGRTAGPVGRIGISIGELFRRSRVAREAHAAGRIAPELE